jgi:pyruvate dehydrogenase E2 component (dihydrolipoamide acetyltransferase)
MEMQALANGVLRKIIIKEGESAPLGQLIAVIGEPDEDISEMLANSGATPKAVAAAAEAKSEPATTPAPVQDAETPAPAKPASAANQPLRKAMVPRKHSLLQRALA